MRIGARRGVIRAAGGFGRNATARRRAISLWPGGRPFSAFPASRAGGSRRWNARFLIRIIVNQAGRRHANEALSCRRFGKATMAANSAGAPADPALGIVEKGPFHALPIHLGDIGTNGGLVTDDRARVLRGDGHVIPGASCRRGRLRDQRRRLRRAAVRR